MKEDHVNITYVRSGDPGVRMFTDRIAWSALLFCANETGRNEGLVYTTGVVIAPVAERERSRRPPQG